MPISGFYDCLNWRAFCKTKIFVQNQTMREILPESYNWYPKDKILSITQSLGEKIVLQMARNRYFSGKTFCFHHFVHSPADITQTSSAFWVLGLALAASRLLLRSNPFFNCWFTVLLHIGFNVRKCVVETVANEFFHFSSHVVIFAIRGPARLSIVFPVASLISDLLYQDSPFSRHRSRFYLRTQFHLRPQGNHKHWSILLGQVGMFLFEVGRLRLCLARYSAMISPEVFFRWQDSSNDPLGYFGGAAKQG